MKLKEFNQTSQFLTKQQKEAFVEILSEYPPYRMLTSDGVSPLRGFNNDDFQILKETVVVEKQNNVWVLRYHDFGLMLIDTNHIDLKRLQELISSL